MLRSMRTVRAGAVLLTMAAVAELGLIEAVWPWFVQMGWHRAGWYTVRLHR
jgi:hypothetical protein